MSYFVVSINYLLSFFAQNIKNNVSFYRNFSPWSHLNHFILQYVQTHMSSIYLKEKNIIKPKIFYININLMYFKM